MATVETTLSFQDRMSSPLKSLQKRLKDTALQTKVAKQQMQQMEATYGKSSEQAKKAAKEYEKLMKTTKDLGFQFRLAREREMALIQAHDEAARKVEENAKKTTLFEKAMNGLKGVFNGVSGRIAGSMKIVDMAVNAAMSAINNLKMAVNQSINDYSKFQSTLTDVTNLLNEQEKLKYSESLEQASRQAIRMGVSIEQANTALFNSVSALGDVDKALSVYENAQKLAKACATSLETATSGLTNVINAYRLSADEASDVSAVFFRAQKVGVTTVGELANAIGGVAPIAQSAGVSYKELLATMAVLTKGGLDTASAATALRASMTALIKPSKQASEVLKRYGVPVGAAELQSKGLAYALVQLQKAAEANPDTMAEMIPNIRALTGVSTLTAESLELVQKTIADMNDDIANGTGYLEAYKEKMNTLEAVQNRFKGANQDLALTIGSILEPIVKAFLTTLTNLVNFINNSLTVIREFSDIIKVVLGGAVIFTTAKFVIMNVTMQMVKNTAIAMWGAITSPISLIIGGLLLLQVVFNKVLGITFQDNVRNMLTSFYWIEGMCKNLITAFENVGIAIHNAFHPLDKKEFKKFEDISLYSNEKKANDLMNKLGLFKDKNKTENANINAKNENPLKDVIANTTGGKALKTQNQGKVEFAQDNLELLHDIATQKYAQYFQQLTPNLNISNMNISNEVDIDMALEAFANAITGSIQTKLA